jgi:SAM-dependent methyltransferase
VNTAVFHDRDGWLSLLEGLFDPPSVERLERIGVASGWEVLELGAGRGSMAAWLAGRVAPGGRVVATDLDVSLLEQRAEPGVEVLRHDVLADDFPPASFDLVHCRAVLVHLSDPERALARIAGWVKPGGVILAEEPWTDVARLAPDPAAARAAAALDDIDGAFARRLPQLLRDVGLERVRGEATLDFFDGGSREAAFFRRVLEGAAASLVASGRLAPEDAQAMKARFEDPAFVDCGWPRIAAVGRKPHG